MATALLDIMDRFLFNSIELMRVREKHFPLIVFSSILSICLMGCGDQSCCPPPIPDTTPPSIVSTSPVSGSSEVPINAAISIVFDDMMGEETFSGNILLFGPDDLLVTGTIGAKPDGIQAFLTLRAGPYFATFHPSNELESNTTYTAIVTSDVTDTSGNAMEEDYVWSFTTGDTIDLTAPMVESVWPLHAATDVPVNTMITLRFTEEMDVATLKAPIVDSRLESYNGIDAVFSLNHNLDHDTTYALTVYSSSKDLAGNSMATVYTWAFTTD